MSARIINFPLNRVIPAIVSFYKFSPEPKVSEIKDNSNEFQTDKNYSDREYRNFEDIIEDEELAKGMFPPDYFMLVE